MQVLPCCAVLRWWLLVRTSPNGNCAWVFCGVPPLPPFLVVPVGKWSPGNFCGRSCAVKFICGCRGFVHAWFPSKSLWTNSNVCAEWPATGRIPNKVVETIRTPRHPPGHSEMEWSSEKWQGHVIWCYSGIWFYNILHFHSCVYCPLIHKLTLALFEFSCYEK